MQEVLVNSLVKLAEEKVWLGELTEACPGKSVVRLTDSLDMTIAVDWDVKPQTKQKLMSVFALQCCQ